MAVGLPVSLSDPAATFFREESGPGSRPSAANGAEAAYAKLPMSFVPNDGQFAGGVGYGARGIGYSVGLTPVEAMFHLSKSQRSDGGGRNPLDAAGEPNHRQPADNAIVSMQLLGADRSARPVVDDSLPGKANYIIGDDPGGWRQGVPTYGRVTYQAVYPGIDVTYHGNQGQFEYDFVVAPGADPSLVNLGFAGVQEVHLDARGDLVLKVEGGELRQHAPVIYQESLDGRVPVAGRFMVVDDGRVTFDVGAYDRTRPLVIDPTLSYSSFLGGAGFELGAGVAVDYQGSAYVVGATTSPDFPVTPGAFDTGHNGDRDGFVAKLTPDGSALVYATFLGGSNFDDTDSVAVDFRGNAYVRGATSSPDFPATPGAFDPTFNGGIDAYAAKLSPNGSSLGFSTFLGGANFDSGSGIAVDRRGAVYVPGITGSPEFPTTPGAFQTTFHGVGGPFPPPGPGDWDAFLTKLSPDGSRLEYSTFLGGSRLDVVFKVAVNVRGEAYVTGLTMSPDFPTTEGAFDRTVGGLFDAYVAKFNTDGSALAYSTLVGGSAPEGALSLAVDLRGSAIITGGTLSPDFPTTRGAFDPTFNGVRDVFVTKLSPDGSALAYSTFLGGAGDDQGSGVAVNLRGEVYVTGVTSSPDYPTTPDALATTLKGETDAFLTVLNRNGTGLAYSTYLGGAGADAGNGVSVDLRGSAYVAGETNSPDFPTTAGAFDPTFNGDADAFIVKISRLRGA
ncbi:MAG: SBBP repeat-containing protein [Actinomycetota bacterium]|nr:SBBP repeat-containing protein [Actinomycetota bacterium]